MAARRIVRRVARIGLDRLIEVSQRVVEIALGAIRGRAADIGRGVLVVEIERLAEVLDRVVEVALLAIGVTAIEIHGRQRGRLVLAGLDHDGASRDQRRMGRVLVQARRAFRDVLNGLRLSLWRLRLHLLLLRLRLTNLLLGSMLRRWPDRMLLGQNHTAALLLSPWRHLRKRRRRLKQKACYQRRRADDLPHTPDHIFPPL